MVSGIGGSLREFIGGVNLPQGGGGGGGAMVNYHCLEYIFTTKPNLKSIIPHISVPVLDRQSVIDASCTRLGVKKPMYYCRQGPGQI